MISRESSFHADSILREQKTKREAPVLRSVKKDLRIGHLEDMAANMSQETTDAN
jgi:hypothetical protein